MIYRKSSSSYQIVFHRGDSLIESLIDFAKENSIYGGSIVGIGAVKEVSLGFYNLNTKSYEKREFHGEYELLQCTGNFSIKENEPFPHCHVVLGDSAYNVVGGHLFSAVIAVTGEFFIYPGQPVSRKPDETTGLALWDLS